MNIVNSTCATSEIYSGFQQLSSYITKIEKTLSIKNKTPEKRLI